MAQNRCLATVLEKTVWAQNCKIYSVFDLSSINIKVGLEESILIFLLLITYDIIAFQLLFHFLWKKMFCSEMCASNSEVSPNTKEEGEQQKC